MRYDILILSDEQELFRNFKKYASKLLKNINISLSFEIEEINDLIEYTDLLIIDINIHNYFEYSKKNINTILLVDESLYIERYSAITEKNILYKPLDFDKLVFKIKHFINKIDINIDVKKEEFSDSIINNIDYPIFSIDQDEVIFSNEHFFKLLNCNSLEEINTKYKKISDIFENETNCITNIDDKSLGNYENKNLKVCIISDNIKKYFTLQKIFLTHNNTSIIILHDISREIEHKNELFKLLYTDNLTKFPNRAKLIEDLKSNNLNLEAICLININSFKEVNDFYGHNIGDSILIDVANIINESIIKKDENHIKLYKFPSDNYCLTNTKNSKESFIEFIKNIIDLIYKNVFVYQTYEIDIRVTAGVSFSNKNNKLITADIALQSAKKDNKDYLIFYDELDKFREYENNMLWTKKLKSAFINDHIEVYFQPIVNNKTLKVDKYECLVRLIEDDGKVVAPFFFLDISKKSNQYTKITKIVLEKSFKKFESLPFEFSVNISYEDIENADFLDFIKDLLQKYDVSNKVVFEILEDSNIKNYTLLISFINEIKALGCKVAIDDFGSGYSNFEHLLKMKIDYLKIDASLIKNIDKDENSYKITKTVIEFAKNLNLKTIAEYVENEEIFKITKELGADYSQGYFFSAPIKSPSISDYSKNGIINE